MEFRDQTDVIDSLALELLAADRADVERRRAVAVDAGHVVPEVGLAGEAHRAALDGALEDPLVRVLPEVLAQRRPAEELVAHLALDFLSRIVVDRQSVQGLVEQQLGMRFGAVSNDFLEENLWKRISDSPEVAQLARERHLDDVLFAGNLVVDDHPEGAVNRRERGRRKHLAKVALVEFQGLFGAFGNFRQTFCELVRSGCAGGDGGCGQRRNGRRVELAHFVSHVPRNFLRQRKFHAAPPATGKCGRGL